MRSNESHKIDSLATDGGPRFITKLPKKDLPTIEIKSVIDEQG